MSTYQKNVKINESLINQDVLDSSNICYLGGTIDAKEGIVLKRLLFRSTRGRAILTTFELDVAEEDVLREDKFHKQQIGYVVLFEDFGQMRKIVERVCQSFIVGDSKSLFEVNPKTVAQDLKEIVAQKCQLRDLIAHSKQTFFNYLNDYSQESLSYVAIYKQFLHRERTIYKALNMFKDCGNLLVGVVWVPTYRKSEFLNHMLQV